MDDPLEIVRVLVNLVTSTLFDEIRFLDTAVQEQRSEISAEFVEEAI